MFSHDCTEAEPGVLIMLPPGSAHSYRSSFLRPVTWLVHKRAAGMPKMCSSEAEKSSRIFCGRA